MMMMMMIVTTTTTIMLMLLKTNVAYDLVGTSFPSGKNNGFCGTVWITLPTSKVAFARRVNNDGYYRYFTLDKAPVLRLDFLYHLKNNINNISDGNDDDNYEDCDDGPSSMRLVWEYYPTEWPDIDKDPYRSCLAKKCSTILQEQRMAFAVCEFLENNTLSSYKRSTDVGDEYWKTYVDPNNPEYQLIILPPEFDRMYQPTKGILLHPQKEALAKEQAAAKKKLNSVVGKKKKLQLTRYIIHNYQKLF